MLTRPRHSFTHPSLEASLRFNLTMSAALARQAPLGAPIGLIGSAGAGRSAAWLAPLLHDGMSAAHSGMLPVKGRVTEALMDRLMTEIFFPETGRWVPGSPALIGNAGIDGLFFHTDGVGHVRDMLVGEAKYGFSRLGNTLSGRQMSGEWINQRLLRTARVYADLAERIRTEPLSPASSYARQLARAPGAHPTARRRNCRSVVAARPAPVLRRPEPRRTGTYFASPQGT